MTIVRVFGNTHLNTACVGKITVDHKFPEPSRITTTTVFDVTGQHALLTAQTTVQTGAQSSSELCAVERDNFVHAEIIASIKEGRDAREWSDDMSKYK